MTKVNEHMDGNLLAQPSADCQVKCFFSWGAGSPTVAYNTMAELPEPHWNYLRLPGKVASAGYSLPHSWYGMSPQEAFAELSSNAVTSNNYLCVMKGDERDNVPVVVTGVSRECVQVGGGKNRYIDVDVLVARYATKEYYHSYRPLSLQPYDIYREYPIDHDDIAEWRREQAVQEQALSRRLTDLWEAATENGKKKSGNKRKSDKLKNKKDNNSTEKKTKKKPLINAAQPVPFGAVGFRFKKEFDAGWFVGEVVEIRPGAADGKDRRCRYEDGDVEDLSIRVLRRLPFI